MDRTETYPEVGGEESGLVPPQGHKGEWPKKIRTLTAVELDRLTIDGDGRFYWDGKLVNYESQQRQPDLDALAMLDRAAVDRVMIFESPAPRRPYGPPPRSTTPGESSPRGPEPDRFWRRALKRL